MSRQQIIIRLLDSVLVLFVFSSPPPPSTVVLTTEEADNRDNHPVFLPPWISIEWTDRWRVLVIELEVYQFGYSNEPYNNNHSWMTPRELLVMDSGMKRGHGARRLIPRHSNRQTRLQEIIPSLNQLRNIVIPCFEQDFEGPRIICLKLGYLFEVLRCKRRWSLFTLGI